MTCPSESAQTSPGRFLGPELSLGTEQTETGWAFLWTWVKPLGDALSTRWQGATVSTSVQEPLQKPLCARGQQPTHSPSIVLSVPETGQDVQWRTANG